MGHPGLVASMACLRLSAGPSILALIQISFEHMETLEEIVCAIKSLLVGSGLCPREAKAREATSRCPVRIAMGLNGRPG